MSTNSQRLTILAQDPAVKVNGALLLAQVDVPHERLAPGPVGYRVKVVDFDATTNTFYKPLAYVYDENGQIVDPFAPPTKRKLSREQRAAWDQRLLADPNFHAQHVYAVVMRILARFEFALGRRVNWSFAGHQLHLAPHAFCEANAYYCEPDRALFFGYFLGKKKQPVFTCLSHDIVAHETTHALLDGLRDRYTDPSGPDQAAFHEGFSDVVALLSVFALKPIVEVALTKGTATRSRNGIRMVSGQALTASALRQSILMGLGKEFGSQLVGARTNALRRSVELEPSARFMADPEFFESHDRGEVFAAAMLRSFLALWTARIAELGTFGRNQYNLDMVIDEGAKVADQLLTMAIRALDYCPSVDLAFGDYVAALLTVDREVVPDDTRFKYRQVIAQTFSSYGITPPTRETDAAGCWKHFAEHERIVYSKTNFESMLREREEVFRFIWENRETLGVDERAYIEVISVRPSNRQGPDGFMLKETVVEYVQIHELFGAEVEAVLGFPRPQFMPTKQRLTAYAGGVLVFDQYGRIKYHIERRLDDVQRQSARLAYLWTSGALEQPVSARNNFAFTHRVRATWG